MREPLRRIRPSGATSTPTRRRAAAGGPVRRHSAGDADATGHPSGVLAECVRRWDAHAQRWFGAGYRLIRSALPVEMTKHAGAFAKLREFCLINGITVDRYLDVIFDRWVRFGRDPKRRPWASALGGRAYNALVTIAIEEQGGAAEPDRGSPLSKPSLGERLADDVGRLRRYVDAYGEAISREVFWLHFAHHFSGEFLALNLEFRELDLVDLLMPDQRTGYDLASRDPAIRARVGEIIGDIIRDAPVGEDQSCRFRAASGEDPESDRLSLSGTSSRRAIS